ncbi:hypothetical protein [Streptomyces sp. NPDC049585]|uniref:hypothetical protein n=1 Tax=Streptomyces sp. NPDC049585 TaxID=3155154 RepID=UPI003420D5E3
MATDEERPVAGPRHAAPRKPLLARLHMPAGKAIALAAMPSAVLMGIGLTPTLAQAKPVAPANPFGEAGCVTAPDKAPEPTPTQSAKAASEPDPEPSGTAEPSAGTAQPGPTASAKPAPAPSAKPDAEPAPPPAASRPTPTPSPSSSPSKAKNPLDPLGLGDVLGGILTGRKAEPPRPAPSTAVPSAPSVPAPAVKPPVAPSPSATLSAKAGPKVSATPGATPAPGATAPSPEASGSPSPQASGTASAGPDKPLPPCPPGTVVDENEHRAFPHQPWYLEASTLTLHGLTYEGVKQITMVNGEKKAVLKFTADSLDIKDLHQIVNNQGMQYHVAGIGTTSTVGSGRITMYTEELKGNLLGLIPSTQSPSSPPPLIPGVKLPVPIFFTNVKIRQAGQYGGTLHIPNLHQYLTPGTYP